MKRVFWRRPEDNAKPHARWSGSSFFALWEPMQKIIGERGRLSFMMLQKTKKMTRQLRRRASKIHMKSCICVHAYLLISEALNSLLLSSAPNSRPNNDKSSLSCALWTKLKSLHTIINAVQFQHSARGHVGL